MVSVIIPNYNHAQYLKQRIESVLGQTYADFELIILDDCSTDNSKEIIEVYKGYEKVSHLVFNDTNSGSTFKQWQRGIELAKGKYIWIAESDDWCEPTLLETLVNVVEDNENCVLAYVQSYVVNSEDEINRVSPANKLAEYFDGKSYVVKYLGHYNSIINAGMAVFKRECYFKVSPRYQQFRFCGDWLFWVEIALQGDVFISGKALNYFRKHDKDVSGTMHASGNNFVEEIKVLKILKHKGLITEPEYKSYLLPRYISYRVFKKSYSIEMQGAIEDAFFSDKATSYKIFLSRVGSVELFKIKIRKRLNL